MTQIAAMNPRAETVREMEATVMRRRVVAEAKSVGNPPDRGPMER